MKTHNSIEQLSQAVIQLPPVRKHIFKNEPVC